AAKGLRLSDPGEKFHEVRKRAKRARYTAELTAPVLRRGARGARRFIRLTTRIQDALGAYHDAIVAIEEIEQALRGKAKDSPVVEAGESLIESQYDAADAALAEFFKIWEKLDRKKSHHWMKTQPKAKAATSA